MQRKRYDYNKHCQFALGTYVQAHDEPNPTNTTASRSLDAIYLGYHDGDQGGHRCLHMQTNKEITRRTVTAVPITPHIIRQIESIATKENMPPGLKIFNRFNEKLYDSAWIAGVDYEEGDSDDDDSTYDGSTDNESGDDDDDFPFDSDSDEETSPEEEAQDEMDPNDVYEMAAKPSPEEQEHPQQETEDEVEDDYEVDDPVNDEEEPTPSTVPEEDDENNDEDVEVEDEINDNDDEQEDDSNAGVTRTRSGRCSQKYVSEYEKLHMAHIDEDNTKAVYYSEHDCFILAYIMCHMNDSAMQMDESTPIGKTLQFVQTFSLKKGIKEFGQRGIDAAFKEMKQLHDLSVIHI